MSKRVYIISIFLLVASGLSSSHAQEQTVGLFLNDSRSYEGYTLFSPLGGRTSFLINNEGEWVNSWDHAYNPNGGSYLLENGHLLLMDREPNPHPNPAIPNSFGGIKELDWDGTLVWSYSYSDSLNRTHHDLAKMPNGNVLIIAYEYKNTSEILAAGRDSTKIPTGGGMWPDHIIEVKPILPDSGEIVWEWHAWDHLIQDVDASKANYGVVEDHPELIDINYDLAGNESGDWLHFNGINYNEMLDQIVLSTPHFNEFWIIDHSTSTEEAAGHTGGRYGKGGDLLYRWGNPAAYRAGTQDDQLLFFNHDAQWIEPGLPGEQNMLVFDNGRFRPVQEGQNFSRIFELSPPINDDGSYNLEGDGTFHPGEIEWTYTDPDRFFSEIVSGMHRLPNGNTIIVEGTAGRIFEVTQEGDVVWDYISPVAVGRIFAQGDTIPPHGFNPNWGANVLFRAYRYKPDYAGLQGRDLTPKGPIEALATSNEEVTDLPTEIALSSNYPNPFNSRTNITFTIPIQRRVKIRVYDTMGKLVATVTDKLYKPGMHVEQFDATGLASGMYLYRIESKGTILTKTMLLIK